MARYIDSHMVADLIDTTASRIIRSIEEQSTADVVKVVRCKDCKWWHNEIDCRNMSGLYRFVPNGNWFCASGERSKRK